MDYIEEKTRTPGAETLDTTALLSTVVKAAGGIATDDMPDSNKPENPHFFIQCKSGVVVIENKNAQEDWLRQASIQDLILAQSRLSTPETNAHGVSRNFSIGPESAVAAEWRAKLRRKFEAYLKKANGQLRRECKESSGGLFEECNAGILFLINDENPLLTFHMVSHLWSSFEHEHKNIDCLIYANSPRLIAQTTYSDGSQGDALIWATFSRNPSAPRHPALDEAIRKIEPIWRKQNEAILGRGELPIVGGGAIAKSSFGPLRFKEPPEQNT